MIKKYAGFTIVYFLGFGLNLLVNRFVFQNLEEVEYGKYSYFFNLLMIIAPIISLNVKDGVMRFYNYNEPSFWQTIFGLSFGSFFLSIIFSFFFSAYFIPFFTIIFYNVISSILRGREQLVQFNVQRILPSLFLLILVYCFKPVKYDELILVTGIGYFLSCLVYYIQNFRKINDKIIAPVDFPKLKTTSKEILSFTIPTIFTALSLWAFNFFDQYIIEYYYGYEYLSNYAAAVRILNVYKVLLSIILVIFPVFYYKNYERPSEIKKFRKSVILGVVAITIICVLSKDLLYLLFGATNYIGTSKLLAFLVIAESLRFISTIFLTVFSYIKKPIITTYVYLGITIFSIITNFAIVPKFGDVGAAYVDIIAAALLIITTLTLNRKYEFK